MGSILDSLVRYLPEMETESEEVNTTPTTDTISVTDIKKLLVADHDTNVINELELVEGKKDPNAKIRNKPDPVFDDKNPKVTDSKDHFPINTIGRARNALARCQQFDSVPSWYKGTLKQLQDAVKKAVKNAYPSIDKE